MFPNSIKYICFSILFLGCVKLSAQTGDTIKIGNQVWTSRNLDVSKFRNGDLIPQVKTIEAWIKAGVEGKPAWCYYNNDSIKNAKYGKLYNWFAVIDSRDLAPVGWRLAYAEDYSQLAHFHELDLSYLKSKNGWLKIGSESGNGINKYGFNIMPSGIRTGEGKFIGNGSCTNLWSITSYKNTDAWTLNIARQGTNLSMKMTKTYGLSVRLIKDDGLRRNNDYNVLLRNELEFDMENHNFDTAIFKLNHIFNSNAFLYYLDYRNLLECYLSNKDLDAAELFFNRNVDSVKFYFDMESDFYNSLGWHLILSQFYKPAVKYLEIASAKFPKDIYILGNLAHAYLLSGSIEIAKKIYTTNIVKVDTVTIDQDQYTSYGNVYSVNQGSELSIDDTSWVKMVNGDFIYFKNNGIDSPYFKEIMDLLNTERHAILNRRIKEVEEENK